MLYPEGSLGPACIGYEIYSLVSGHPSRELIKVYKSLGLEKPDNPITLESLNNLGP